MPDKLLAEFLPVSTAEWVQAIRKDTGVSSGKQPFYRAEDLAGLPYLDSLPGEPPYLRGGKASNDWTIVDDLPEPDSPSYIRAYLQREGGGTCVDELAFALAAATGYLAGDAARASEVIFAVSIGANFFEEIAKLRALRFLWSKGIETLGGTPVPAIIRARTLVYNRAPDAHFTVIQATTAAMAAAIGGVDSLYTPHARNVQLILKAEACFDQVTDAAGGSYYVEVLTNSFVQAVWKLLR